jgi:peptide deformylase
MHKRPECSRRDDLKIVTIKKINKPPRNNDLKDLLQRISFHDFQHLEGPFICCRLRNERQRRFLLEQRGVQTWLIIIHLLDVPYIEKQRSVINQAYVDRLE